MQEQGRQQEEAAVLLGAGLWQILWRVMLPDIKWALLSGRECPGRHAACDACTVSSADAAG